MSKPNILIQLDTDPQPSVFDAVVAIDAGAQHLLRHGGVTPDNVRDLVYGAMFTRGPDDLRHTAIFVGGSDVSAGERLLAAISGTFFGRTRVSVMLDSNGANTTAAAAVLAARRHLSLEGTTALVLGGTGPVGRRVARLLALEKALVRIASRDRARAEAVCQELHGSNGNTRMMGVGAGTPEQMQTALDGVQLVIAAGAPGALLLPDDLRRGCSTLAVAIDLNAVPPLGIAGIEAGDKAKPRDGVICYGAFGVGGSKMKIHRAAIARLFSENDQTLDAEQVFEIGKAEEEASERSF